MIGDRSYDFEAARANRVRSLAAAWGYGSSEEFAMADAVAHTPAEISRIVCL
jgi:phosphoglycolate phosphatase